MSDIDHAAIHEATWVIEPRAAGLGARGREVWQYRRLLRFFAVKVLQKQYARTVLGWAWLFIRPLFPLLVKTLIFAGVLNVASDGVPYFLFLVIGTTIWELFAAGALWGTRSLEINRGLIVRIYVPRLILPVSMMAPAFLTFTIHLAVVVIAIGYYWATTGAIYVGPASGIVSAVFAALLTVALALGISLWTSVPALRARDVRFTLTYVLSFWIFLTPVMYPLSSVPPSWRGWMALNPMAAYTAMFKVAFFKTDFPAPWQLALAIAMTATVLVSGLWYFNRAEADAADKV